MCQNTDSFVLYSSKYNNSYSLVKLSYNQVKLIKFLKNQEEKFEIKSVNSKSEVLSTADIKKTTSNKKSLIKCLSNGDYLGHHERNFIFWDDICIR